MKIISPNPPAPTAEAIVVVPMFIIAEFRNPEKMVGIEFGISIAHKIFLLVIPMPFAASIIFLFTLNNPEAVLKTIGTKEYKKSAKIEGAAPIPIKTKTIAITAIEGTD